MADTLITVSQLKCACIDPDWRARWLRGENPPTMRFGQSGGIPVQGQIFHQLAEQFTEWLVSKRGITADLVDAAGLWVISTIISRKRSWMALSLPGVCPQRIT